MANYEWNGYTFDTKEEMIEFSTMKKKADEINEVYETLYEDTSAFYNVNKVNRILASYLIDDIHANYKAIDRFYNAQYMVNQLISIL